MDFPVAIPPVRPTTVVGLVGDGSQFEKWGKAR